MLQEEVSLPHQRAPMGAVTCGSYSDSGGIIGVRQLGDAGQLLNTAPSGTVFYTSWNDGLLGTLDLLYVASADLCDGPSDSAWANRTVLGGGWSYAYCSYETRARVAAARGASSMR